MRHQCHGGKCSEDEVRAKRLLKHETTIWTNGETCRSPVRTPSFGKTVERIKAHTEGRNNGGQLGQNDH